MRFGKRKKKAAAVLSLAVSGILGVSATASAETGVDGFPVLHAASNSSAHTCTVIGADNKYPVDQAVVCVDILTYPGGNQYYAYGQLEAYCQVDWPTGPVEEQCAQINIAGIESVFANGLHGRSWISASHCGHQYGACDTGRWLIPTGTYSYDKYTTGCSSQPDSNNNVWMVAAGGSSPYDSTSPVAIELPNSDQWTYLGAGNTNDGTGLSTGHQYICE